MQKLENLEITKVAFVPEGDNKKADVLLFKGKPAESTQEPTGGDSDVNVIKRVLLAFGKALGFDKDESANRAPSARNADPQRGNAHSGTPGNTKTQKGVERDMKFDKSKLTPDEIATLEALEKKAGVQEEPETDPVTKNGEPATDPAPAGANAPAADPAPTADPAGDDDIYKGLHPAVAKELKDLRKRADAAEERELSEVAKKYEILGKKPNELAKTLKTLKAAGGTAYDDMISVLDASLATVEKSGAFNEVGKSGSGQPDAWDMIEKHADEIMKAAPTMTRAQAIEKACEQHPELVAEYEKSR